MEKWQLAGIISGNSRTKLILPSGKLLKADRRGAQPLQSGMIGKAIQQTLRKMTRIISLF
jgi:hypothetical protein